MSVGTGAFSSIEAERGVEVNVVKDENAYLGITQQKESVSDGETVARITNQFPTPLELTVTLDSTSGPLDKITVAGKSLETNSTVQIGFDIGDPPVEIKTECRDTGQATFSLNLAGEIGDGRGTVRTTEQFQVFCEGNENKK
ncbi:hypothetical protein [Halorubrum sp. Atlit-28R]|uniref:hypothetical protein n=1 Tax=Halorubrum sp. Atlit-28R TaxID=2282129 RepID=UPI001F180207|nr:hypothetical protein [Halorubrum sp. Atlit-28R]